MDCIEINEAIENKYKICFESTKKFWNNKRNQLVKEYFEIVDIKEINNSEIDDLQMVSQKIPILNGKVVLLRLEIVDAEITVWYSTKKKKRNEVLSWGIGFDGYGNEDLCIEDEDGCKYETINQSFYKYCPQFNEKYNLSVGADNPIRTFMFLVPIEDSKLFIGLNNIAGKLSISNG